MDLSKILALRFCCQLLVRDIGQQGAYKEEQQRIKGEFLIYMPLDGSDATGMWQPILADGSTPSF